MYQQSCRPSVIKPNDSCLISESCHVHVRDAECSPGAISEIANAVAELLYMGQEGKNQKHTGEPKLFLVYKIAFSACDIFSQSTR